jgi:hypothetical protein
MRDLPTQPVSIGVPLRAARSGADVTSARQTRTPRIAAALT